jgi:hypothetical protein
VTGWWFTNDASGVYLNAVCAVQAANEQEARHKITATLIANGLDEQSDFKVQELCDHTVLFDGDY